ncbi:DUF4145 domain-containing protein [Desulfuromonas thiophila]|uniref:DUF4145 domain-containing protein n=1 Tax=Desulfuromonas thiophila TaxID=57664 RepID=A0A1G7DM84_9BACT|nr:DUF4145 domain-containing protein [Desulfuromonas thiophila]SDE52608.1 protein of unknown function [Desulfuromonas thiophila]
MTETIRKVAYCPHCGNKAPQRLIHSQNYYEKSWSISDNSVDEHPWGTFVAVCETCGHILLYDNPLAQFEERQFHTGGLEFPTSGKLHKSVPKLIAAVYEEAFRIKSIAPNAFAVQIRRALEAVCDDRGEKKGTLQAKINKLTEKGEIPKVLSEASDVLRLLGNIGAHGINESVHQLQAFALDDFFKVIIDYVYVAPSKLEDFKSKMEKFQKQEELEGKSQEQA